METIFAPATAPGRSGVSVVRISGPQAFEACRVVCGDIPPARSASLRHICNLSGDVLDNGLVITFPAPRSFTGEDVVELHLHGSVAVVDAVLRALGGVSGCRLAAEGEFTRRALSNGKMDLTQVEGLADLIDAQTEVQRRQAQQTLSGDLTAIVESWRVDLIRSAALLEAVIDFADEDVPEDVSDEVSGLLLRVLNGIDQQLSGWRIAERIRDGFEVAIIGPPNAGKSTLLNALAGREAAITSSYAGTTRDVIEVQMDLQGIPVTLLDTAGLRDTDDPVEAIGVARALDRARSADLRVFLSDELGGDFPDLVDGDIHVLPKGDLRANLVGAVSGITGAGVDALMDQIGQELKNRTSSASLLSRLRHVDACERARVDLDTAIKSLDSGSDFYDLAAEDVRSVVRSLEMLVGRIDVENLLDEIFSSFCLGK